MDRQIRVLILEDNPSDAELMKRELRKAGFDFSAELAQDKKSFLQALEKFIPDIVLADYSLPEFDGITAIGLARKRYPELPGIIVSGAIGEEVAIEALKSGATDYVLKERLKRIGPVVKRALEEAGQLKEKNHVKEALQESEKRFRSMAENLPSILVRFDRNLRVLYLSPPAKEITGVPAEDFVGKTAREAGMPDELCVLWERAINEVFRTGQLETLEFDFPTKKGLRVFYLRLAPEFDGDGKASSVLGVATDITERKQIEEQLKKRNERFRLLSEAASLLLLSESPEKIVNRICKKVMALLDCHLFLNFLEDKDKDKDKDKDILTLNTYAGISEEEAQKIKRLDFGRAICGFVVRDKKRIVAENIQQTKDGRVDFVRSLGIRAYAAYPLLSYGKAIGTLTFGTRSRDKFSEDDLEVMHIIANQVAIAVERKRVEQRLKESESRYRSYAEVVGQIAWVTNAKGEVEEDIPYWRRFTGQSYAEVKGNGWAKAIHPDDLGRTLRAWQKAASAKAVYEIEYRLRRADGEYRYVLDRGVPVFRKDGSLHEWVGTCIDITERNKQEERLKQSEERYALAQRAARIGSWDWNILTGDLVWSDTIELLFGFRKGEFKKTFDAFLECVHPDDRKFLVDSVNKSIAKGAEYSIEHRAVWPDGSVHWVHETGNVIRDSDNKAVRMLGIVQDIDKRKKQEKEVEMLARFPAENPNPVLRIDKDCRILLANKASGIVLKKWECKVGEILPKDWCDRVKKAFHTGRTQDIEIRYDSTVFLFKLVPIKEGGYANLYGLNITARREAEEELKELSEELEQMVEERTGELRQANKELVQQMNKRQFIEKQILIRNAILKLMANSSSRKEFIDSVSNLVRKISGCRSVGIRILDKDARIPYESFIGFNRKFWEKENWLCTETDECACIRVIQGKVIPVDKPVLTAGGSFRCEDTVGFIGGLPYRDKDKFRGECLRQGFQSLGVIPIRYGEKVVAVIHLADEKKGMLPPGKVEFIESLTMHIGEGIKKFTLADSARQANELLERIFASSNVLIAYLDKNFNFIRVNQAYAQAEGKIPEFFSGKNHFDLYPDIENEAIFKQVAEGGKPFIAYAKPFVYSRHPEQGVTYWDWSLQPIKDTLGRADGFVLFLVDVTKRKHAEDELLRTQKELSEARRLSDIGTLAATVAHELRNPLAAMRMAAYNIKRKAQNPDLEKHLVNIEKKILESDQIINNLLFYSRIKTPHYERVNIKELLDECLQSAKERSGTKKVAIDKHLKDIKDIAIDADPLQLRELFNNLLNNSFDALSDKDGRIRIQGKFDNKGFIKVHIKDNGHGIDNESLARIFEPFFTTKAKGTGLGLTVCSQITKLHRGTICINSKIGHGTEVVVTLPVNKEASG